MGTIKQHDPVLLIAAVVSRYDEGLQWAQDRLTEKWGECAMVSPAFEFVETSYYQKEMGTELKKQFFAFAQLIDPRDAPDHKHFSNALEVEYAESAGHSEPRPLNIDPGYISEAKLVLTTTKDRDHRIYLRDGIFAEVTLHFQKSGWLASRWTYPDYQREDFQAFFTRCREHLRSELRAS